MYNLFQITIQIAKGTKCIFVHIYLLFSDYNKTQVIIIIATFILNIKIVNILYQIIYLFKPLLLNLEGLAGNYNLPGNAYLSFPMSRINHINT